MPHILFGLIFVLASAGPLPAEPQETEDFVVGLPASDALGPNDLWGNPSFVGGAANGGTSSHGVW